MSKKIDRSLLLQLEGCRLTTAEILYHLPDYPELLQSYIWQEYDLIPDFPHLHEFLTFWEQNLDGKLHTVKIMAAEQIIEPSDILSVDHDYTIH